MNLFVLRTWLTARFTDDERGVHLIEYVVLVALIALAVVASVVFLRGDVNGKLGGSGSTVHTGHH